MSRARIKSALEKESARTHMVPRDNPKLCGWQQEYEALPNQRRFMLGRTRPHHHGGHPGHYKFRRIFQFGPAAQ